VRVSRFVTCHGMAINIQNDLSIFDLLIPCGLDGVQMTSAQKETGRTYDMEQIKGQLGELLVYLIGRASSHDNMHGRERPWIRDCGQDARTTESRP